MIDYIIEILESNNRLIVPELGAFIVKQRTPLKIVFNEFLQYNDNMLVETISKKENIDISEAKNRIDKFTHEIKSILNQGEYYALDKLGDLIKNPSGKIILCEPNSVFEKSILYQDNDIPIEIEEAEAPETNMEPVSEDSASKTELHEKSELIESETPKPELIESQISEPEIKKISEEPKPSVKEKEKSENKEVEIEIPKPYVISEDVNVNREPSTIKTKSVVIWTLIILLANMVIAGIFLRNHIGNFFRKNVETVQPVIAIDSAKTQDSTITSVLDTTIKDVITSELSKNEGIQTSQTIEGNRYYIVAGVFKNEANADNLVSELIKKGFKPEKFEKGEMFGVSYESFTSKDDAEKALIRIKSETDAGAWLKTVNY